MGKTTRTIAAAMIAAAMLTACGGGNGGSGGADMNSSASTVDEGAKSGEGDSDLDEAAKEAGIEPDSPPEPIATVTMPGSNIKTPDAETDITLDLLGLRRDGDLLVLNLGFTPKEGQRTSYYGWTGTSWAPQIVDTTNLKVHSVVEGPEGRLATGTGPTGIPVAGGQTLYLYAVFAAPPKDVTTVTVKPADGAPAFTHVEIQ